MREIWVRQILTLTVGLFLCTAMCAEAQLTTTVWNPAANPSGNGLWSESANWTGGQVACPDPPSTYYFRQVYSCFFKDPIGVKMLSEIGGAEHVAFETDYPHSDSTWPHSREAAATQFGFLAQASINRIAHRDRAAGLARSDPARGLTWLTKADSKADERPWGVITDEGIERLRARWRSRAVDQPAALLLAQRRHVPGWRTATATTTRSTAIAEKSVWGGSSAPHRWWGRHADR
jgi:hypothetical protein